MYQNVISSETQIAFANAMKIQQNFSPEYLKITQEIMESPVYQKIIKQQEVLNQMTIPAPLMAEIQAINDGIQSALKGINFVELQKITQSQKFLNSALAVQHAEFDFLDEMKKIDNYQQKTLDNTLKEIRLKNNGELELPENFPTKAKKKFKSFFESAKKFLKSVKNFWSEHENDMIALLPNIQPTFDFLNTGEVSNLGSAIATSLLIKKIFRNTSENEF